MIKKLKKRFTSLNNEQTENGATFEATSVLIWSTVAAASSLLGSGIPLSIIVKYSH